MAFELQCTDYFPTPIHTQFCANTIDMFNSLEKSQETQFNTPKLENYVAMRSLAS